ncbi:MAG: cupin domain-containing protein [Coriobacteriia bacterium]|nr:cupin domain-containing protein [Coriobacteriia bacterium]MBS5478658.1 cupin domain-containing protein [Coriobacteriia bacterium]
MNPDVKEVAGRIRALREDLGITQEEMAQVTERSLAEYVAQESGEQDPSFSFLSKCAERLGVDMVELLTGESPRLARYAIMRAGDGVTIRRRSTLNYLHLAPYFKDRLCEPLLVTAPYDEAAQRQPIHHSFHAGQELDFIIKGSLRFVYEDHEEVLNEGDFVIHDSSRGHGMIATGGQDCTFLAIIIKEPGDQLA